MQPVDKLGRAACVRWQPFNRHRPQPLRSVVCGYPLRHRIGAEAAAIRPVDKFECDSTRALSNTIAASRATPTQTCRQRAIHIVIVPTPISPQRGLWTNLVIRLHLPTASSWTRRPTRRARSRSSFPGRPYQGRADVFSLGCPPACGQSSDRDEGTRRADAVDTRRNGAAPASAIARDSLPRHRRCGLCEWLSRAALWTSARCAARHDESRLNRRHDRLGQVSAEIAMNRSTPTLRARPHQHGCGSSGLWTSLVISARAHPAKPAFSRPFLWVRSDCGGDVDNSSDSSQTRLF